MSAVTTGSGGSGGGGTAARRAAKEAGASGPSSKKRSGPRPTVPPARNGSRVADPPGSVDDDRGTTAGAGTAPAVVDTGTVARRRLDPDALAALEEQRTFLLGSLRDLEAEHAAGDVDEVDYAALKDDYTARAATVIRAIEDREAALDEVASARKRSPARVAAIAAGVLVVAIVAGVLMAQASGRREAGDTITGDIRQDSRNLLAQAQSQFGSGQMLDAIKTYDQVLEIQPANTEALTYKGWLLYRVAAGTSGGQVNQNDIDALKQRSAQSLDDAVRADPSYPDAHVFRAIIARDEGRNADAAAELALVKPDQVPQLMRDTVDQLRTQVAQK